MSTKTYKVSSYPQPYIRLLIEGSKKPYTIEGTYKELSYLRNEIHRLRAAMRREKHFAVPMADTVVLSLSKNELNLEKATLTIRPRNQTKFANKISKLLPPATISDTWGMDQ